MSTNQYGLDADYFRRKLERVLRDVNSYRPDEMARELARMARTADEAVLREPEFALVAQTEQQPMAAVAGLPHWEESLSSAWPAEAEDAQGAWIIGAIDEEGNKYPVATIEADQYDAPGDSEKIARAIIALWAQAFAAPVAKDEPAEQWISVKDRLPELDAPVWLYDPDVGTFFGMRESSTDGWEWVEGSGLDLCPRFGPGFDCVDCTDCEPTHWLPLPAAPTLAAYGGAN